MLDSSNGTARRGCGTSRRPCTCSRSIRCSGVPGRQVPVEPPRPGQGARVGVQPDPLHASWPATATIPSSSDRNNWAGGPRRSPGRWTSGRRLGEDRFADLAWTELQTDPLGWPCRPVTTPWVWRSPMPPCRSDAVGPQGHRPGARGGSRLRAGRLRADPRRRARALRGLPRHLRCRRLTRAHPARGDETNWVPTPRCAARSSLPRQQPCRNRSSRTQRRHGPRNAARFEHPRVLSPFRLQGRTRCRCLPGDRARREATVTTPDERCHNGNRGGYGVDRRPTGPGV